MISGWATIIDFLSKHGQWGILVIAVGLVFYLLRVILDEDKTAALRARIYKAIYGVTGKSSAEKRYIENDVSSRINLARRKMPFATEYLPRAIKVQWFETGTGETAHIKEDEIVVRLDPAESEEKNIVVLTGALVKRTSLVGIRHIIKEPVELSMDLNLVKNLLKEIGDRGVLDWFFRNEYGPAVDKSEEMREWNGKIVEIDERGLFTRLLLVELDNYSKQIMGKPSTDEMFDEIVGLIDFLFRIATKAVGQDAPLEYISRHIKIGVMLVGETSKILYDGLEPYLKAFAHKMRQQLASIYVIVFDKELLGAYDPEAYEMFVRETKGLSREIEQRFRIQKHFQLSYTCTDAAGNKRKAKVSHYIPQYVSP